MKRESVFYHFSLKGKKRRDIGLLQHTPLPPMELLEETSTVSPSEERENTLRTLNERLTIHDDNRKATQEKLHEICDKLRAKIDELENKINKEIEEAFTKEDNRLQTALNDLRSSIPTDDNNSDISQAIQKAKAELLVMQSYTVIEKEDFKVFNLSKMCELQVEKCVVLEMICVKKPTDIHVIDVNGGRVTLQFTHLSVHELNIFSNHNIDNPIKYKCLLSKKGFEDEHSKEYLLEKEGNYFVFTSTLFEPETTYEIRVKTTYESNESEWSDETVEFVTQGFKECCIWKECPGNIGDKKKYSLNEKNFKIATRILQDNYCTIIGNTSLPLNKVISWNIKILKSKDNNGSGIFVGVSPSNINQNDEYNRNKCGWYFYCYNSTLYSGPPHNYKWPGKEYGPRKKEGDYIKMGDIVGVVMDTGKGELSFIVDGINLGVAYEGIPLDKPLVPCVIPYFKDDSVELDVLEVEENVDSSIPVLSNITAKSVTWDTITITWDSIERASFYQIEVDENKLWSVSKINMFTIRGFYPESEHHFRVRVVCRNSVNEWSDVVKGVTEKAPNFSECVWKKCPDDITDDDRKYFVDDDNLRIATKMNYGYCTIIGNTPLPINTITSWNIKILKSKNNNGDGIFIGVSPSDTNQNEINNRNKCGWYFSCCDSTTFSGPPHDHTRKQYGPRKEKWKYVHTGDSIGVVMDTTTKGELSFVLNGINLGVAYEEIPLDKPLVPCVLLLREGDSVELVI